MTQLTTSTRKAVAAVFALLLLSLCAFAQGPASFPPTWVFARAYGAWSLVGQQASTYTFNGAVCQATPLNNGTQATQSFFMFSGTQGSTTVYNPVFIQDANAALNEVVTPTSTTNSQTSCGFAATTSNSHISFTLTSGTAGLQEAISSQLQNTPAFVVILDKYWYQLVAAMPSTTTPQSIIAAAKGSANVYLMDVTQSPWQPYEWNGTKYVAASMNGAIPFSSVTVVSPPVAATTVANTCATNGGGCITTATTGGSIPDSSAYTFGYTYVTALGGETTLSTDTAGGATVTTGSSGSNANTITVTSPPAATNVVGWRPYLTAASGASLSEILYASSCATPSTGQIVLNGVCAIGTSATITAIITGTATVPSVNTAFPSYSGSNSPLQQMVSYPPFTNSGAISASATSTLATVNFAPGFLNTLGRHIKVHGTGIAVTNSTPGTLTFAMLLASVPGVTSVTPFTAVSGTTTASATVNFTFDIDFAVGVTGVNGKLESHGTVCYNLAGTAVCTPAQDLIHAVGSSIDLTKQDQLQFTLTPATTAITASGAQIRQLTVQVVQ